MSSVDCGCCGTVMDAPRLDGVWTDGESVVCGHCEAVNQIGVDDTDGEAYSMAWRCVHGVSDVEPCDQCEAAAGVAV